MKDGTFELKPTGNTGGRKTKIKIEYAKLSEEEIKKSPQITLDQMPKVIENYNEEVADQKVCDKELPGKSSIHRFLHSSACEEYMGSTISFKKLSIRPQGANDEKNLDLRKIWIKELYEKNLFRSNVGLRR